LTQFSERILPIAEKTLRSGNSKEWVVEQLASA